MPNFSGGPELSERWLLKALIFLSFIVSMPSIVPGNLAGHFDCTTIMASNYSGFNHVGLLLRLTRRSVARLCRPGYDGGDCCECTCEQVPDSWSDDGKRISTKVFHLDCVVSIHRTINGHYSVISVRPTRTSDTRVEDRGGDVNPAFD